MAIPFSLLTGSVWELRPGHPRGLLNSQVDEDFQNSSSSKDLTSQPFSQTFWSVSCLPQQIALVPVPESHISACKCFWNISPCCSFFVLRELQVRQSKGKLFSRPSGSDQTGQSITTVVGLWEQGQLCCLHGLWFSRASWEAQVGYFYPGGKGRLEMPPRFPTRFCLVLPG